jgi:hypothetical protein
LKRPPLHLLVSRRAAPHAQAKFLYRHLETEVEERMRTRYSLVERGGGGDGAAHGSPGGRAGALGLAGAGFGSAVDESAMVRQAWGRVL